MNYIKLIYFIKRNKFELLSFFFAICTSMAAYRYGSQPGINYGISVLLTTVLLMLTLYFHFREKDSYYIAFDSYSDKEDWFGSGKFELDKTNNAYLIADTDAGFIFSKCLLWKDYKVNGKFKIQNKHLGIILRASNLSNYVMLQITKNSIRPHIRANGGWIKYETDVTGLVFEEEIKDGRWYEFEFIVKGEDIQIKISDATKILIDKRWVIVSGKVAVEVFEKQDHDRKTSTHVMDITVSYDYGSIGFRNGHGERALVKNLIAESINKT